MSRSESLRAFLKAVLSRHPNGLALRDLLLMLSHWTWVKEATIRKELELLEDEFLVERISLTGRRGYVYFWHDGKPCVTSYSATACKVPRAEPTPWWGVPSAILTREAAHV